MPVNLLISEPEQAITGKEKPTNLLPEIAGPSEEEVKEAQKPFIQDAWNALNVGLDRLWANTARTPAAAFDLMHLPTNFLYKSIGRPDWQVQSPDWLMDNPVAELYDYQTQAFEKEIAPTKSLAEAMETKDFSGLGRHIAIEVVKNVPQQIGIILSYMAGYPGAGLTGMGMLSATDSLREGRKNKKDPAMNAYNALTNGVIEAGFESIGTFGALKKWSGVLANSFGKKAAKEVIGDVFKTIFQSMLAEGNEELWTSLAQDFSSMATGINPNAMKGSLARAYEAGIIGGVSGALLTGPGAIKLGQRSAALTKMQDEVNKVTKTLLEDETPAETPEISPVEGVGEEITPKVGVIIPPKAGEGVVPITEAKPFAKRIQEIREKFKRPETIARKEVKATQEEIIRGLEASELEATDKAKFIKTIKNIQTPEQLSKVIPDITTRIERLEVAAEKRGVVTKIKKALKTTKPLKVGQKRVGKFNYETNKQFDTLREYNKLSQEKAQVEFDTFPEEVASEVDLIKKRFLSLKANGASASAEIHRQVLADIKRIKELGKKAKDEADLEKMLNRQEKVEGTLSSIDRITGNKKTVMGKVANAYRRGFSNIYSMLNSIGGKAFAETYNPELSENRRNTATYRKTLKITVRASKIYNEKNIIRLFETMSMSDYQITDIADGLTTELSKLDLIDIYNSIKNEKKKQDYYDTFGKDQVDILMMKLTPQDVAFGDSLQEAVQEYREILNKRNIEITGRDLGFIENYWPATSEHTVSVIDDMRVQGETPSALKERAKAKVIPIPKNAWYKAQRHIAQAEHVNNLSREYEALKRIFNDRKVKHAVIQKYGEDVYNTVIAQVDNISLNKQTERIDAISGAFQKAINNWVTAKIALNPSTFVRQLMSVGNYAEQMNTVKWTTGFFKGILHPKKTFDYMWKNAPFLEARFNKGYSEALQEAMEGAKRVSVNKHNWTKFLTALVRAGDVTAIVYGGYPLMLEQGADAFETATLKAQQSGLSSSISQFQNSRNPFTRLFLAFKNTSNQYFRKMADAVISYQNGDITLGQFTKTMSIYAVIQPILYVSAGFATKAAFGLLGSAVGLKTEDEDYDEMLEKFLNDIMIQLIVSPVNAMPVIDDAVRAAAKKLTGQKIYQVFSTPLFDDLESGFKALTKKEVTGEDYLKTAASILEPATALPIKTGIRYYEILTGKDKDTGKKLVR